MRGEEVSESKGNLKLILEKVSLVKGLVFNTGLAIVLAGTVIYMMTDGKSPSELIRKTKQYNIEYQSNQALSEQFQALSVQNQQLGDYLSKLKSFAQVNANNTDLANFIGYFGKTLKEVKTVSVVEFSFGNIEDKSTYTPIDYEKVDVSTLPKYNSVRLLLKGDGVGLQKMMDRLELFNYNYSNIDLVNKSGVSTLEYVIDLR